MREAEQFVRDWKQQSGRDQSLKQTPHMDTTRPPHSSLFPAASHLLPQQERLIHVIIWFPHRWIQQQHGLICCPNKSLSESCAGAAQKGTPTPRQRRHGALFPLICIHKGHGKVAEGDESCSLIRGKETVSANN